MEGSKKKLEGWTNSASTISVRSQAGGFWVWLAVSGLRRQDATPATTGYWHERLIGAIDSLVLTLKHERKIMRMVWQPKWCFGGTHVKDMRDMQVWDLR